MTERPQTTISTLPPDDSAAVGDTLAPGTPLLQGQFLIEGFLNAGGFGITYLARDSLDRRIVIKECFPSQMCCRAGGIVRARAQSNQSDFEAVVRLFGQEARRLAKLEHPNIVGVRDVFEENGSAYMALDFVDGRDLHDVIEQETWRLDPDTIRDMALKLLDAIGHVHARGMLHRDISPDNILLTHDDTPILIDFGAARDTARRKSRILSTLHVVKDGYSPQEFYLQAGEQTPASDLYSLAASLYRAITGDPPVFSHRRLAAIAERKPDPYVPLVGTADGYDPRFLAMIDKALEVFARDRLQSAAEWLAGMAGAVPGAPTSRQRLDDAKIVERIKRLVDATNPEVAALHERRAQEQAERAKKAAEDKAARDAAQQRRLAQARREAEEAECAYNARLAEERTAQDAARAHEETDDSEGDAADLVPAGAPVAHVAGAGGVNRAKVLAEREAEARRAREEAERQAHQSPASRTLGFISGKDKAQSAPAKPREPSRGSFLGLRLGGIRRRAAAPEQIDKEEGLGR